MVFFKKKKWTKITVNHWRKNKSNFIIQIQGIFDRSIIKNFTNSDIMISQYTLPKLKQNNYYWNDIISCEVFNTQKYHLGVVIDLIRTKNNDVLVIENLSNKSKKKIFIPFIEKNIIKNININNKIIIVQWS